MSHWYRLRLDMDDNRTFLVTAKSFPEVTTCGKTEGEACRNGLDAILEAMAARIADGDDIPHPLSKITGEGWFVELPVLAYLKAALYMVARDKAVSRAELARRLSVHREQVDRLFRLGHKSRIDQIEAAAKALGVGIEIDLAERKAA